MNLFQTQRGLRFSNAAMFGKKKYRSLRRGWSYEDNGTTSRSTTGSGDTDGSLEMLQIDMDISKNRGKTQKWMVKIMENPIKMGWFGGFPIIFGNTHMVPNQATNY